MNSTIKAATIAIAAFCAAPLNAMPVTWEFVDTTFVGGGTITGQFTYDAMTNDYSGISVITTEADGTTLRNTYVDDIFTSAGDLDLITGAGSNTGDPILFVSFLSDLTDAGGFVGLGGWFSVSTIGAEGTCASSICNGFSTERSIASGAVQSVVAAVPVPASGFLLLVGAGTFLSVRSRRKAT